MYKKRTTQNLRLCHLIDSYFYYNGLKLYNNIKQQRGVGYLVYKRRCANNLQLPEPYITNCIKNLHLRCLVCT